MSLIERQSTSGWPLVRLAPGSAFVAGANRRTIWNYANVCICFARHGIIFVNMGCCLAPDAISPLAAIGLLRLRQAIDVPSGHALAGVMIVNARIRTKIGKRTRLLARSRPVEGRVPAFSMIACLSARAPRRRVSPGLNSKVPEATLMAPNSSAGSPSPSGRGLPCLQPAASSNLGHCPYEDNR